MSSDDRPLTYFDIVWRQFRHHRLAYLSLWALLPLVLLAVFAPLLASNQPFVFWDGDTVAYPWFVALFHQAEPVDFAFNMLLLAVVPSLLFLPPLVWYWRRKGVRGPKRWLQATGVLLLCMLTLIAIFGLTNLAPANRYQQDNFSEREFRTAGRAHGVYPPIRFGPREQDTMSIYKPPLYRKPRASWSEANDGYLHLLGTDDTGHDVLVQMIYGTRLAITVGFVAVGIYMTIGCLLGAIAGYFGGPIDALISRAIEVVLLFPSFFLILTLVAMIGPSIYIIMFVIGITGWPTIARLIRGEVLKQRNLDYVAASRALGASHTRILLRHILPNSLGPAMVAAPFGVASAVTTEAGLSLLGFGVRPPAPSWGSLLNMGNHNYSNWWLVVVPSIAIFATVTIFNLVGTGMRDAMDPRLRDVR